MKVRVRLFSIAREITGSSDLALDLGAEAVAKDVLDLLQEDHPALRKWKRSLRLAVNREYVSENHRLSEGDEVAVIPPVSGG